jgi:KDO2-lipid IV(A) lauroyltransferase
LGDLLCRLQFKAVVVDQNLKIAYPEGSVSHPIESHRQQILRESYRSFGCLVLEIFLVLGPLKKFVLKYVDLSGVENLRAAQRQGKGVIFLSSHVGNWEIMAATGGLLAQADLMLVTKQIKPAWLHQAIEQGRSNCHVRATYEPRTMRDVLSHLKKNGAVGFVLDQYVGPPVGVRVPLFGVPVGTAFVVATLAKRTGAVVLPVQNFRTPDGRWKVVIEEPLQWQSFEDQNYEIAANTALYNAVVEKHILSHPSQWLWIHRRFKGDLSPLRENEWSDPRVRK